MAKAKSYIPQGLHAVTPHLVYEDSAKAIDWYTKAFGAEEVGGRAIGPDGKVMHAEIRIGDSLLYLNDQMGGGKTAKSLGGSPITLWIYTPDVDALFTRAVAAGATVAPPPMGPVMDQFWGDRLGMLFDPFGFGWVIATRKEDLTPEEMQKRQNEFFKNFAPQGAHH
jgi:PhnB protein